LNPAILEPLRKNKFFNGNERALYEELKPYDIWQREQLLETESERQGDIFFVPLGMSWKSFRRMLLAMYSDDEAFEPVTADLFSVFGTRHELHGTYVEIPNAGLFAEGILRAPDHEDRNLLDVHFLSQTEYLVDPTTAD
jgi:hypothetical protein